MPITIYTAFSTANVFKVPEVNTFCNQFINSGINQLGFNEDDILLTGTTSKIIQGASPKEDIQCISFITDKKSVFDAYINAIQNIVQVEYGRYYKTVMQIATPTAKLELWYSSTPVTKKTIDGINIQKASEIPINIK